MLDTFSRFNQRLIMSLIFITLFVVSLIFTYTFPLLPILIATLIGFALHEYYQGVTGIGYQPLTIIGITTGVSYTIALYIVTKVPDARLLPVIILSGGAISTFFHFFASGKNPVVNLALTWFPQIWLTLPLSLAIAITYSFGSEGPLWLLYLVAVTKITDTCALFFGKIFGSHALAPYISPKKTWEGAIGGLVGGVAMSAVFYWFLEAPLFQWILWGALLSVFAQIGDLAESLIKRDLGIKDSSKLPGLGGVLDIVDSLCFTTPLLYLLLLLR